MNCKQCNEKVEGRGKLFCSIKCFSEEKHQAWVRDWMLGKHNGLRGGVSVSRHIRKWLKQNKGEKCEICGWAGKNPVTNTIPLHLDHIDGNWKNNRPENLRFLCPNHHALTSSYGSLNRGNGRPFFVQKKIAVGA